MAPSLVLPRLAVLLLPSAHDAGTVSRDHTRDTILQHVRTRDASERGDAGEAPAPITGGAEDEIVDSAAERRLKAAQAICQVVMRLGETVTPNAEAVMGALLIGCSDRQQPAVRSSCLACLAQVAATLRFALHPWAVELLQIISSALEGETDAQARQAACYALAVLLEGLGNEALVVLPSKQVVWLYRRLKLLRDGEAVRKDPLLHGHITAALEQMQVLGQSLFDSAKANLG